MERYYETVFILTPVLSDEQTKDAVAGFKQVLKDQGAVIDHEEAWGIKQLAYPIDKKSTGIYHLIRFQAPTQAIAALELKYRHSEQVLRFSVVAPDKHGVAYLKQQQEKTGATAQEEKKTSLPESNAATEKAFLLGNQMPHQKKYCRFRKLGIRYVDYKNPDFLLRFLNEQGKILPRYITGNSIKFQKKVAKAIKRARQLALIPFVTDGLK